MIVSKWQTSSLSSPLKTIKHDGKGNYDNDDNNNNDDDDDVHRRQRQETDNVKWSGGRLNSKTNILRNHLDDGEEGEDDESETASNNDESSNNNRSDDESVTVNFMDF